MATDNFNLTPPNDSEAEMSLLGSILLNNKILDEVADLLVPDYFYDPRHTLIFRSMLEMWSTNQPIDVLFVERHIQKLADSQKVTGDQDLDREYLLELVSKSSLSTTPQALAKSVKEKYLLRTIVGTADDMRSMALADKDKPEDVLDQAQKMLYEVSLDNQDKNFVSISTILSDSFERISELYNNKIDNRGIPTGFTDIDKILGGLHNSDLIILAARPSMGKTAFTLEIARRIAMQQQVGVAIFSLEMGKDQLVDRILASVSKIDSWKIRTGKFSDSDGNQEFLKLGQAIGQLDQAPIWIDDSGSLNLLELRSKARRLKSRHNIGVLFVDYLQLMTSGSSRGAFNRVQEVSEISRGLKILAKELDIPVVALSQLSRGVEGRDDKRPMLSDLRDSGSIEQDADVVMFVHREEMYNRETKRKGVADILISKHRNGQTGAVELAWVHRLATFENLDGARIRRRSVE